LNKPQLIAALKGTERPRTLIVDEQSSEDIVREVCKAHKEHADDYDLISHYFEGGTVYDICERLWVFCKNQLTYKVESAKVQNVGCPYWILTHGVIDCKNFSSFIAGNLDSMKRRGLRVVWEFRFISDRPWSLIDRDPDHVFVVVNPNTEDIWVDPVLNDFDYHFGYFYRSSRRLNTMGRTSRRVGAIGGYSIGLAAMGSSAENALLVDVASYASGLSGAMTQTKSTNTLNIITESVLLGVATAVFPEAIVVLAALKAGAIALDKTFGVGAASSRIITDLSNLNISGMISDIFNGRTYNTDQYWAAVYYQYYVLGNNITDINYVSDADVLPALKWFIDRAGVFISGREHIIGLCTSATAYANYYGVNSDTTTDMTLVNAASLMAKSNWPNPGTFGGNMMGAWKNTAGVYDQALINIAASQNETPEQYVAINKIQDQVANAYINYATTRGAPAAATTTAAATTAPASPLSFLTAQSILPGVPNAVIFGIGVGAIVLITSNNKK
jgi:hypothetical protein